MGYDLFGIKAKSKKGEYFRNNVWWWDELANYVCITTRISSDGWHSNDGKRISEKEATMIYEVLTELLDAGEVQKYSRGLSKYKKGLPRNSFERNYPFSTQNVRDFAIFCRDSGGFEVC